MLLYTAIWHCFVYYSKRAQLFSRWRDGLLERSTARAKATRSGNSLRLEVQWTSNASFASERVTRASVLAGLWNICRGTYNVSFALSTKNINNYSYGCVESETMPILCKHHLEP